VFWSACATFVTMFALGAARSLVTNERWWRSGLETLGLGALVAVTAYGAGVLVARLAGAL
jgi:VIT1/CCC1 family predicted Fe2+/Mn2+ transporter